MNIIRTLFFSLCSFACCAQNSLHVAVLKYNGGGDYYANPTALWPLCAPKDTPGTSGGILSDRAAQQRGHVDHQKASR